MWNRGIESKSGFKNASFWSWRCATRGQRQVSVEGEKKRDSENPNAMEEDEGERSFLQARVLRVLVF